MSDLFSDITKAITAIGAINVVFPGSKEIGDGLVDAFNSEDEEES